MNLQDPFDECYATKFVGRTGCLKLLENTSGKFRLIEITGLRAVGKSRTIKEFLKHRNNWMQQSEFFSTFNDSVEICIDMRFVADVQSIYTNINASLGIEPDLSSDSGNSWINRVSRTISSDSNKLHLLLFDNAEDMIESSLKTDFLCLCDHLMKHKNVRIYITSTTKLLTADLNDQCLSYELKPMPTHEARDLLENASPNVNLGEFEDSIIKLCEGIPLIILMVGSELTADEGLIQPEDMVELLICCRLQTLSRGEYAEEDRIGENTTGTTGVRQYQLLRYYTRRSMIKHESSSGRLDIQGILRECLDTYYSISNLPEVRRRFCQVFTPEMIRICNYLGTEEYVKALSQFSLEQPNLQKLLTEVYQTTDDIYPFFIRISEQCYELINRFMYKESELFYNGCLKIASSYHQVKDMVTIHLAIGHLYSDIKGEFKEADDIYQQAMKLLKNDHQSVQMAQLRQQIGWNFCNMGLFDQSVSHLEKAMKIHRFLHTDHTVPGLQATYSLAVAYSCVGKLKEAETLHMERRLWTWYVVEKCHYQMGITNHGMGVMYQFIGDSRRALEFYFRGLELKLKCFAPLRAIVYTMSHIANIYTTMRKFETAVRLLEKALLRLRRESIPHKGALSLACDAMGKILLSRKEYKKASDLFEEAVEIREKICPNGVNHIESLMHLALAQKGLGKFQHAIQISHQVLKLKEETYYSMPANTLIIECLEGLVDIYRATGQRHLEKTTLERLHSELLYLERVRIGFSINSHVGLHNLQERIQSIQSFLDSYYLNL